MQRSATVCDVYELFEIIAHKNLSMKPSELNW